MRFSTFLPLVFVPFAYGTASELDFGNWRPQQEGELRAPCPALNSMANHGFLPRDGKGLTIGILVKAMMEVFNVSQEVSTLVSIRATQLGPDPKTGVFSLGDLNRHNAIEHDASLSRADYDLGADDQTRFNKAIFDSWFKYFDGMENITLPAAALARYARVVTERYRNGNLLYGGIQQFSSYAETLLLLKGMVDPKDGACKKDYVRILFEEERLPYAEGWRPPKIQLNAFHFSYTMLQLALATPEKSHNMASDFASVDMSSAFAMQAKGHHGAAHGMQIPMHQGL